MSVRPSSAQSACGVFSAAVIAGLGLWFSQGTLDVIGSATVQRRMAMLPSWPELMGFIGVGLIFAVAAALMQHHASRARTPDRALVWDSAFSDAVRPLFAAVLLTLPYLPWLPDQLPVLRILGGPLRWLVWAVIFAQVGWILAPRLVPRSARAWIGTRAATVIVFGISAATYAAAAIQLTETDLFPGGDEAHYLVITQSLLSDHDLKIENNHQRGDYREYFPFPLKPDYRTRGKNGEIYSIHPVGLPLLALPAFAVAGYRGVICLLILTAATTAMLLWRWLFAQFESVAVATFGWAAVCLAAPFTFNSIV